MDQNLLSPSLDTPPTQPIYSMGAMIAAAFFGGSFAVPLLALENSRRLRRLGNDAIWLILALLAATILVVWVLATSTQTENWGRDLRMWNRGGGFLLAGGFYLLHRRAYRTMRHTGLDSPTPYAAVAVAVIAGIAITLALIEGARSGVLPIPAL